MKLPFDSSKSASERVVVIGAGVIGTACAYYLAMGGRAVTIIDSNRLGSGCSRGNCGLVRPSHVLPLAEPGGTGKILRAMLKKNAPFSIKPRLDPELWKWLLNFTLRCNGTDMMETARARHSLLDSSASLYRELLASEPIDCEWESRGTLFVYRAKAQLESYGETDRLLRESFGIAATRLDRDALTELEPALKPEVAGAWYYPEESHLRPDKLMESWRRVLEHYGVAIREGCEMSAFDSTAGRATAIHTSQGTITGDAFVVATGAWTPKLRKQLGSSIPIQPGKGYSITMPRPANCPGIPLIFPEHKVAVTPMQSAYRLGSTMEFAGYDTNINRQRLGLLKAGAEHYLQQPYTDPLLEEWYGWRPMTPDGKPIIDRSAVMGNVFIAAGHGMEGISMAPATGKLVAEIIGGLQPHIDPRPFSLRR